MADLTELIDSMTPEQLTELHAGLTEHLQGQAQRAHTMTDEEFVKVRDARRERRGR